MTNENMLSHYRKEEQPFVEKVVDWAEKVSRTHITVLTDFLDPRQLKIVENIVNSHMDLAIFFDGGYLDAERVRAIIAPDYWTISDEDLKLTFFRVEGDNRFVSLKHKDYMGALLNIGIKREKFGDILISENNSQYIIAQEIADYVRLELTQIGHIKVKLIEINKGDLIVAKETYQTVAFTVASLRADAVISHLYNISRAKAMEVISKGNFKLNWQVVDQSDYKLKAGDVLSIRGFGRSKFLEEEGTTKKGRFSIKFGKLL